MRNKDELKNLLSEIKSYYKASFNRPYDSKKIIAHLKAMEESRFNHFVKTRLGHLPDRDLIDFIGVVEEDATALPPPLPIEVAMEIKKVGRPTKK